MICRMCLQGGRANKAWREHGSAFNLDQAREAHSMCTGCDCQHAVGADSLVVNLHGD